MSKSKLIILASTSPFRKKLMEDAGIAFTSKAALGDELTVRDASPSVLAAKRAEFKALDVAAQVQEPCFIIGADQVLGLNGKSYDKAQSPGEAEMRLQEFQGQTHYLHSAFCIVELVRSPESNQLKPMVRTSRVVDIPMKMKQLSKSEIIAYVGTEEWKGCVGCYRIEGQGRKLFESIGASESAIIGLPMKELQEDLNTYVFSH